jgi:hypothetical protein
LGKNSYKFKSRNFTLAPKKIIKTLSNEVVLQEHAIFFLTARQNSPRKYEPPRISAFLECRRKQRDSGTKKNCSRFTRHLSGLKCGNEGTNWINKVQSIHVHLCRPMQ